MLFSKPSSAAVVAARKSAIELRDRLKEEPFDVSAALELADALMVLGQKREAVNFLGRFGTALQNKGKFLETIATWKRAAQIDPGGAVTSSFLIRLDLEKLQALSPAAPPPASVKEPGPSLEFLGKKEAVTRAVNDIPLLKDIPSFLIELVMDKFRLISANGGEAIFEEGAEGSSLIFVVSGQLDVIGTDDQGRRVLLSRLDPGDVAGETSFLSGLPRSATLIARGPVHLLELERRGLESILKKHRKLADALTILYKERLLDGVLARSPLFSDLSREERDTIARVLTPQSARPGDQIIREGETDRSLYILKRGQVRVTASGKGKEVALALLKPHDFFGDLAAAKGIARTASVTAVTPVELLRLDPLALEDLLLRHPGIREALESVQLERFIARAQLLM